MKTKSLRSMLAAALCCGFLSTVFAAVPQGWTEGFSGDVQAKAEKEDRCILLLFTGSDWCPACRALKKNVLETEEFLRFAEKELIPVWIDFPKKERLAPAIRKSNEQLLDKFLGANAAFPTTVLLDPKGKVLGKIVGAMSADAYLATIREMKDMPPAFQAVRDNRKDDLINLFESGVSADSVTKVSGTPLLLYAVTEKASDDIVSAILKAGANVNQADVNGTTPLHAAADAGSASTLELLLKAKADPNVSDRRGITPLALAIRSGDLEKVRALVSAGVSVNEPMLGGRVTPLILAVRVGKRNVVTFLLTKKADPNLADPEGNTPLHYAAALNDPGVTMILLQAKAKPAIRNKGGKLPSDLTSSKQVLDLLKAPAAKK